MSDVPPIGEVLDGEDGKGMINFVVDNQLPGETDAMRCAWLMGTVVLQMRKRYRRAHLSQVVMAAYHVVRAAEAVRELEKKRQQDRTH